jgi:hypothetical protein
MKYRRMPYFSLDGKRGCAPEAPNGIFLRDSIFLATLGGDRICRMDGAAMICVEQGRFCCRK